MLAWHFCSPSRRLASCSGKPQHRLHPHPVPVACRSCTPRSVRPHPALAIEAFVAQLVAEVTA